MRWKGSGESGRSWGGGCPGKEGIGTCGGCCKAWLGGKGWGVYIAEGLIIRGREGVCIVKGRNKGGRGEEERRKVG